jgi:hypothetical protein
LLPAAEQTLAAGGRWQKPYFHLVTCLEYVKKRLAKIEPLTGHYTT